ARERHRIRVRRDHAPGARETLRVVVVVERERLAVADLVTAAGHVVVRDQPLLLRSAQVPEEPGAPAARIAGRVEARGARAVGDVVTQVNALARAELRGARALADARVEPAAGLEPVVAHDGVLEPEDLLRVVAVAAERDAEPARAEPVAR